MRAERGAEVDVEGSAVVLPAEWTLLDAAQRGDASAFEQLVARYRGELHAHCYRMLGSVQDAEDALQEALLGTWRGLAGFAGRSSIRSWLYRITTNACLKLIGRRPPRLLAIDYGSATTDIDDLGVPVTETVWLEPYPQQDPQANEIAIGLLHAKSDHAGAPTQMTR